MEPEEVRKLLKRVLVIGAFFALAAVFYVLGRGGGGFWRGVLIAYALIVSLVLVLAILLQSGKGGGLASIGGIGGESLLGARSATPIAKATAVLGGLLLFICMLLARQGQDAAASAGVRPLPGGRPPMSDTAPSQHSAPPAAPSGAPLPPLDDSGDY